MALCVKRSEISDGIFFTQITDSKFKVNRISVTLAAPLLEETAADFAILPLLLRRGYSECPSAKQFSRMLSSLYGANCDGSVRKAGDNQLLTISIGAIDDKYTINGEHVTVEIAKILCSLLLDPVIEDGGFSKQTFETEKRALIDSINAELNDKIALASTRCQEIMFEGQPAAISRLGALSEAEKLSRREIFDSYNELLKKAHIEIIFTGCGDANAVEEIFTNCFSSSADRDKPFKISSLVKEPEREKKRRVETFSVSQAKLSLGLTCGGEISEDEKYAMQVMCLILGGAPFSKLFLNVREKMSLCYYCSAAYDKLKNTILINSGIEEKNKETAEAEILNQLKAIQSGDLSDEELENARKLYTNVYTGIEDNIARIEGYFLTRLLCGNDTTPSEELKKLLAVTREDVINAARKVWLNTVYFMAPKKEDE